MSISSSQLFDWSASIDLIESYQAFLDGITENNHTKSLMTTKTIEYIFYNCTPPWFGSRCQYFLSQIPTLLEEYIDSVYSFLFVLHPPPHSCYIHLQCNGRSSDLCLDWREICDGRDDCTNGEDEKDCWLLEANECDKNEYRCHNGQCIPLDFLNDDRSHPDCMDRTDEPGYIDYTTQCAMDITFRCEETSCYPLEYGMEPFACGDGQCIMAHGECRNNRHLYVEFPDFTFDWLLMDEDCFRSMTCLTGRGFEQQSCYCGQGFGISCALAAKRRCPSKLFFFPPTPLLFSHIYLVYNTSQADQKRDLITPMYVCFDQKYCTLANTTIHSILNKTCIEFGALFSFYPGWDEMLEIILSHFSVACASSIECPHPSLYSCQHSSKCISTVRLLDGVINCPLEDDEMFLSTCLLNETNNHRLKCYDEKDSCISPIAINDGYPHCENLEDEIDPIRRYLLYNIMFKFVCDGIPEMYPIKIDGQYHTDETNCEQWPCNNSYTYCNTVWNCPKGEDELACNNTSIVCPPLHHPCILPNTTHLSCLSIEKVHDGIVDCLGGSDERQLCRQMYLLEETERYHCWNRSKCVSLTSLANCNTKLDAQLLRTIPDRYSCLWKNLTSIQKHLCSLNDIQDYDTLEWSLAFEKKSRKEQKTTNSNPVITTRNFEFEEELCYRGVSISIRTPVKLEYRCLCPPSLYGDHCEYQNQRVSLTVQPRSATDWRSIFTFIFLLITDQNEIESYDYRYYNPSADCAMKWNIYLLYQSRPKNPMKNYSVRIDVYEPEAIMPEYRASWYYPLDVHILPVHRLTIQITIPSRLTIAQGIVCSLDCNGHGSCTIAITRTNKKMLLCRCDPGWFGDQCQYAQEPSITCACAPNSICIRSFPSSICVCPLGRMGPRCYINFDSCQGSESCLNGGRCIPNDERKHSSFVTKCLCPKDFWGDYCQYSLNKLIISFHPKISIPSLIYLHLIQDKQLAKHQHIKTFKRILPYETSAIIRTTVNKFHLAFGEFDNNYYWTNFKTANSTEIEMYIFPENRCLSIKKLFNSSFIQWDLIRRIKYYHIPCEQYLNLSCFYDEIHMCTCNNNQRHAKCILFDHKMEHICQGDSGNCENEGECFQDDAKCPSTSICHCADCFYGSKCQFSNKGLSFSLDSILGYQIRPDRNFRTQIFVIKFSVILLSIMFIINIINGILSILVFSSKTANNVGCGFYLLVSSFLSILTMIMLMLKFAFLLLAQMTWITNRTFLHIQCLSMDFVLQICLTFGDWLNVSVAIERAVTVLKGSNFDKEKSKRVAKYTTVLLFVFVAILNLHDPINRHLIFDEDEQRTWCIVRYSSSLQFYNSIIKFFHFLTPFILNIISSFIIILNIARRRSHIQQQNSLKRHIHEQLIRQKHLLISPIALILLALPRLIISIVSDCVNSNRDPWLLLIGYLSSFAPSLLVFVVFVLPSKMYKAQLKLSFINIRSRICRLNQT